MKPLRYLLPAITGIVIGISVHSARAQDASFGCKILLCVASQNPSWQGVSYCVPPVLKLLSIRKVHPGYWPACPEAGTHKPGYAEYEDCPAGMTAATIGDSSSHGGNMRNTAVCAKPVQVACTTLFNRSRHFGNIDYLKGDQFRRDGNTCMTTEIIPRPKRKDPYYFDIRNKETGSVARYYFNLRN
jgi:hypothetical protein